MRAVTIFLLICSLSILTSCANSQFSKGQQESVDLARNKPPAGPQIGHNLETTISEMAQGTLVGYIVGREMDRYDRQELNHVFERGVSGSSTSWINPDIGNKYSITPEPAYSSPQSNQPCRKAQLSAIFKGKEETTYTTACREANGQWQLR